MDKDGKKILNFLSQEAEGTKREKVERLVERAKHGISITSAFITPAKKNPPNVRRKVSLTPTTPVRRQIIQPEVEEYNWARDDNTEDLMMSLVSLETIFDDVKVAMAAERKTWRATSEPTRTQVKDLQQALANRLGLILCKVSIAGMAFLIEELALF